MNSTTGEGSLTYILDQLSPDKKTRGTQGELLFQCYLKTDPVFAHEYQHVWTWQEFSWQSPVGVPWRWKNEEAGIDLIAQDRDGDLTAIQIKTYDEATTVTMHDMARFVAESGRKIFAHRLLIATTNKLAFHANDLVKGSEKPVQTWLRADLERANVTWPVSLSDLSATQPGPWTPRPHQDEAVNDVANGFVTAIEAGVGGFSTSVRGQLIMACGTGKTMVSLWVKEKMDSRRTLVVVPSLALMSQTHRAYRANQTEDFRVLLVCSDESVRHGHHDVMSSVSELPLPPTTNPVTIAEFLRADGPCVVICTYQSLPVLAQAFALGDVAGFDLAVADEAHHIAGPAKKVAALFLDGEKIPARCRLFMTATSKTYTARVVKAGEEADYRVVSMDDKVKFGSVLHHLPFGKAIKKELLTDFQVVVMTIDKATDPEFLATYRRLVHRRGYVVRRPEDDESRMANDLAVMIALIKAMRSPEDGGLGLRRNLLTANTVARAQRLTKGLNEVNTWMPEGQRFPGYVWTTCVDGEMPVREREQRINGLLTLDADMPGVVGNASCLGEGVDVPAFDSVTIVDPKQSVIVIEQLAGRPLRLFPGKKIANIFLPVVVNSGEDVESVFNKSAFAAIRNTLLAMRSIDPERLGEQIDTIMRERGKRDGGEAGPVRNLPNLRQIIPATVPTEFARAIEAKVVELASTKWEEYLGAFDQYVVDHDGDGLVPDDYQTGNGLHLGWWVQTQCHFKATGNPQLTPEREQRLNDLPGWEWKPRDAAWKRGWRYAKDYRAEKGHICPEAGEMFKGFKIGQWVKVQRRFNKDDRLSDERIQLLEQIDDWVWEWYAWDRKLAQTVEFKKLHGRLPSRTEGPEGLWLDKQRRRKDLNADRVKRFSDLLDGEAWDLKEAYFSGLLGQTVEFQKSHGRLPSQKDGQVGVWCTTMRLRERNGKLSPDHKERIEKQLSGWDWSPQRGPKSKAHAE